jgi:hypothetical protein
MAVTVFFVHGLSNQLWVVDKTLGMTSGNEFSFVTHGLLKGQRSWASIKEYLLHGSVIFWSDVILYCI